MVQDGEALAILPWGGTSSYDFSLQVVRDGLVVAQSVPSAVSWRQREALVEGVQGVYRPGHALRATASVHPAKEGLRYSWLLRSDATGQTETLKSGTDASALSVDQPVDVGQGDYRLSFVAQWTHSDGRTIDVARRDIPIHVSNADPSTQLLLFNALSDHYHQGNTVTLQLVADPAPTTGDRIDWQWRWPGEESWRAVRGATGLKHTLVAEQALDGVQVRAALAFAEGGDPALAEPVTIEVDDHGAAPSQKVTIAGETDYEAGDTASLTAQVAPATVLDRYQWYVKAPGAAQPTPIAGANVSTHSFSVSSSDDGSEYSVAVLKPGGQVAYGPSAPVQVTVAPRESVADESIGGVVPATLALTLGAPASFGPFMPGVAREYTATTTATVVSSGGEASLAVADPSDAHRGHLVNGTFALRQPLHGLGSIRAYDGPVANDVATVEFKQRIGASDPLRTGSYSKTLAFTLSTSTP